MVKYLQKQIYHTLCHYFSNMPCHIRSVINTIAKKKKIKQKFSHGSFIYDLRCRAGRAIHLSSINFCRVSPSWPLEHRTSWLVTPDQRLIDVCSKEPLKVEPKTYSLLPNDLWTCINASSCLYGSIWSSSKAELTSKRCSLVSQNVHVCACVCV